MLRLPSEILIEDESLRDGLQNEERTFSIEEKLHFIHGLEAHGVRRIQVSSFVHPKWVPQMADTDELFAHPTAVPGVVHTALVLNLKGVERALAAGARHLSMSISASETHSLRNTNRTFEEAKRHIVPMIETALSNGIEVRAGIQKAYYGLTYGTTVPRDGDDTVPKYADIAKACGVEGVRVRAGAEFKPALEAAIASGKPTVIDVAMVNNPTPTSGHWNILDIYSPDTRVSHVAAD